MNKRLCDLFEEHCSVVKVGDKTFHHFPFWVDGINSDKPRVYTHEHLPQELLDEIERLREVNNQKP